MLACKCSQDAAENERLKSATYQRLILGNITKDLCYLLVFALVRGLAMAESVILWMSRVVWACSRTGFLWITHLVCASCHGGHLRVGCTCKSIKGPGMLSAGCSHDAT